MKHCLLKLEEEGARSLIKSLSLLNHCQRFRYVFRFIFCCRTEIQKWLSLIIRCCGFQIETVVFQFTGKLLHLEISYSLMLQYIAKNIILKSCWLLAMILAEDRALQNKVEL